MEIITKESEKMAPAAQAVLAELRRVKTDPLVLALYGDLGAGKTAFVKALAAELGVADVVISPTFLLMRAYETDDERFETLVHIDAYRLEDPAELRHLDWDAILKRPRALVCVEWADKVEELLPKNTVRLYFEHLTEDERKVTFSI